MKEVIYYECESCGHIIEDKDDVERCSDCGKEVCPNCVYTNYIDKLPYCFLCAEKDENHTYTWEIVRMMSEGLLNVGDIFINEDNDEIFISDDGELLNNPYCTSVSILLNDKSKWRTKR